MPATAQFLKTEAEKQEAEQVVSLLAYKITHGLATDDEKQLYWVRCEDLAVYDWGTEAYQNYIPNQIAAAHERKLERKRQARKLIAPAPQKTLPKLAEPEPMRLAVGADLPPLPKRSGKFGLEEI